MKNYATGSMAIGIAEDLVIVFFLISLIDYAITVRSKVDPEDIMKMFARALVAQFLVFNYNRSRERGIGGESVVFHRQRQHQQLRSKLVCCFFSEKGSSVAYRLQMLSLDDNM